MSDVDVKWNGDNVTARVKRFKSRAFDKMLRGVVDDIRANAPVDTGFMRDSTYAVTKNTSIGSPNPRTARLTSAKYGGPRDYISAGAPSLDGADAVVGVGAVYAFENERRGAFVYPAVERGVSAFDVEEIND